MNFLTKKEQWILLLTLFLLLTGWAVKAYREAHPRETLSGTLDERL